MNTQVGCQGGYLASEPAKPKRMAWMAVSRDLFKERCGAISERFIRDQEQYGFTGIHVALLLPDNAKIVNVSVHARFMHNEITLQIECPDFREVLEGHCMEQVYPMYYLTIDLLDKRTAHFEGWSGAAALDGNYTISDRNVSTDCCSEELGHFADPAVNYMLCYCKRLALDNKREWSPVPECAITPSELGVKRVPKGDCWRCKDSTNRKSGPEDCWTWECPACSEKPLL